MPLASTPSPRFDTFYRYDALTRLLFDYADAHPELLRVESIGKSHEGRDIWLVTLTNSATGADTDKPALWTDGNIHAAELTHTLRELVPRIACHGTFNFMLSNGEALWAHCATRLCYVMRQHPFGQARLQDDDISVNFAELTTPQDRVAIVVTEPLTRDETWTDFAPGELKVFAGGAPLVESPPHHHLRTR